mgnify:CR=1 FL=1
MAIGIQRAINQIVGSFAEAGRSSDVKAYFKKPGEPEVEPQKTQPTAANINRQMMMRAINNVNSTIRLSFNQNEAIQKRITATRKIIKSNKGGK